MMASMVPRSRNRRVCWVSSWAIQTISRDAAGVLQCRGNAPIAGTGAVDAEQIGIPFQEVGRQHPRAFAVVAPFERRQRHEIRIFARQDLMEPELAFGMIAQRQ